MAHTILKCIDFNGFWRNFHCTGFSTVTRLKNLPFYVRELGADSWKTTSRVGEFHSQCWRIPSLRCIKPINRLVRVYKVFYFTFYRIRWKEKYFVLTTDYLQCYKKAKSSISLMGTFSYKVTWLPPVLQEGQVKYLSYEVIWLPSVLQEDQVKYLSYGVIWIPSVLWEGQIK